MQSTFAGIELGKRGIQSHTQGLQTVGHNITNASTEGYSRQRVELKPMDPLYVPGMGRGEQPGQIGQGTEVSQIKRIRDELLDTRIVQNGNTESYWGTREKYLLMVDQLYKEPYETSLQGRMDRYWSSMQELSLYPDQMANRQEVLQSANGVMDSIHLRYRELSEIQNMVEDDLEVTVNQANNLMKDIAGLNLQIQKSKALGDNPNDLMDMRDLKVEELSGLMEITVDRRDNDEYFIHSGGISIVQGDIAETIQMTPNPANEGFSELSYTLTDLPFQVKGGQIGSLLELRDTDIKDEIQKLDLMTLTFTDGVNEIHRDAFGQDGSTGRDFFVEYPAVNNIAGNYDSTGDGEFDQTLLYRVTGGNSLDAQEQIGLQGTMIFEGSDGPVAIDYNPTDTVGDIIDRINTSTADVAAMLDRNGKLTIKGVPTLDPDKPDFVIHRMEDTGQFLTGYTGILEESGPEGAFAYDEPNSALGLRGGELDYAVAPLSHPSGWIEVNDAIKNDPRLIAASFSVAGRSGEIGDGNAALAISNLRNTGAMLGKTKSFDDYFADLAANIGSKGKTAVESYQTSVNRLKDLKDQRDSISGVNVDEELAQMIKYQHGYNAAARYISTVNSMLDTIINRMGV